MQNRYTGDIGDFSKLGILRTLRSTGLSIGVNWYLVPDEKHNSDGRYVDYLYKDEYRACDSELWLSLKEIINLKDRQVKYLEEKRILDAAFFSDCLDFQSKKKSERQKIRTKWFEKSLAELTGKNIIFADPDNGLIVPSAMSRPKENKYVLPEELAAYYAQGSSVVYYQHKARYKDDYYAKQLEGLLKREEFLGASSLILKFKRVSLRYYLFIMQPEHQETIKNALDDMLNGDWGKHFCKCSA